MTFRERSAWIMMMALLLSGLVYVGLIAFFSSHAEQWAAPPLPLFVMFTATLVVVAIVGHILAAARRPRDANQPLDERERLLTERAGYWSSHVLGFGIVMALLAYLAFGNGEMLFHAVFATLFIAQFAEYLLQVVLFRRAS